MTDDVPSFFKADANHRFSQGGVLLGLAVKLGGSAHAWRRLRKLG
jgi:hypothetical protein